MGFNIVLLEPEIPMNTGNIGRLSLACGSTLHLVKPFGFELDDTRLKRAGLDYWKHVSLKIYDSADDFFTEHQYAPMAFFSSHATKDYLSCDYSDNLFLIFGKESVGLSPTITKQNKERLYKIPIYSLHIRSLNLANAVSIIVYEGLRQLKQT